MRKFEAVSGFYDRTKFVCVGGDGACHLEFIDGTTEPSSITLDRCIELVEEGLWREVIETPTAPAKPKPVRVRRFKEDVQRDLTKAEMRIHQLECELNKAVDDAILATADYDHARETLHKVETLYRAQTKVLEDMTVWTLVKRWFRRG